MPNTPLQSSSRSDWISPRDPYILAVEEVFGGQICLDPASSAIANSSVRAQFYFDGENADGLEMSWAIGDVLEWSAGQGGLKFTQSETWNVFLNPPYGRRYGKKGPYNLPLWVPKLMEEYRSGNIDEAILLVNSMTAQKWFQPLWDCPLCFPDHRMAFVMPETMEPQKDPTQANVFAYVGPYPVRFWAVFKQFGPIVRALDERHPEFVLYDDVRR